MVSYVIPFNQLVRATSDPKEIKDNGLKLPGFDQLTYLDTVRRPHGTGVRRLGRVADEDIIDKAVEEADKKWDPENHPSSLVKPLKSSDKHVEWFIKFMYFPMKF